MHADKNCYGPYFFLKSYLSTAQAQLKEFSQAESTMLLLVSEWEKLSCADEAPLNDAVREVNFGILSDSVRDALAPLEELASVSDVYQANMEIVSEARQRLANVSEVKSNLEKEVKTCMADVQERYESWWATACSNQANRHARTLRICIGENLPRFSEIHLTSNPPEESARDYCEARLGAINSSQSCELPTDIADRLNARRSGDLRRCQKVLEVFD